MKKNMFLIIIALIGFTAGANAQDSKAAKPGVETVRIKTSAVCDMCKEALEKAMAYEKGVKQSDLDLNTMVLSVSYDAKKTTPEKIRKAVTMAGYDADEMPADKKAYDNLHTCCKKDVKH